MPKPPATPNRNRLRWRRWAAAWTEAALRRLVVLLLIPQPPTPGRRRVVEDISGNISLMRPGRIRYIYRPDLPSQQFRTNCAGLDPGDSPQGASPSRNCHPTHKVRVPHRDSAEYVARQNPPRGVSNGYNSVPANPRVDIFGFHINIGLRQTSSSHLASKSSSGAGGCVNDGNRSGLGVAAHSCIRGCGVHPYSGCATHSDKRPASRSVGIPNTSPYTRVICRRHRAHQ